jgi:hypothetical protein
MSVLKPVGEAPSRAGVYLLYKDDRLVYVGQTKNLRRRLVDLDRRKADRFYLLPVDRRKEVETTLLRALDPAGNDRECPGPADIKVYDSHRDLDDRFRFRLPSDIASGLRALARADGRTVSGQLRQIVREAVEGSDHESRRGKPGQHRS